MYFSPGSCSCCLLMDLAANDLSVMIWYLLISSLRMILFLSICLWASFLSCFILFLASGFLNCFYIWLRSSFSSVIYFWVGNGVLRWIIFGCWFKYGWFTLYLCLFVFGSRRFSVWFVGCASCIISSICPCLSGGSEDLFLNHRSFFIFNLIIIWYGVGLLLISLFLLSFKIKFFFWAFFCLKFYDVLRDDFF